MDNEPDEYAIATAIEVLDWLETNAEERGYSELANSVNEVFHALTDKLADIMEEEDNAE